MEETDKILPEFIELCKKCGFEMKSTDAEEPEEGSQEKY